MTQILNKKYITISLALVILFVVLIGVYFYFQNYINVNSVTNENSVAVLNNGTSYKKVVYIGFGKEGQPFWTAMGQFVAQASLTRKIIFMDLTPTVPSAQSQIDVLNSAIDQRVDGIIIGANDPSKLTNVLGKAKDANIPVVAIDTKVDEPAIVSFIATDNSESAKIAGNYVVKATGGKGTLLILGGAENHPNSIARVNGVKSVAEKAGMKVIVDYTDWDSTKSYSITNEELSKPNNNIVAIFSASDPGIIAAEQVVENKGLQGKIILVGFDGIQDSFKEIKNGKLTATMAQPVKEMARKGIETIMDYLSNKKVLKENLIPGIMVDKINIGYFLD